MEQEIWKDCVGYEGFYQVSDLGRVRSLDRRIPVNRATGKEYKSMKGKILRPAICNGGLHLILSDNNGTKKTVKIHNLVLEAFVGKRPQNYEACHFPDSSYSNNKLSNLRWDTKENNERDKRYNNTDNRGERHGMAKLKNEQVINIKKMINSGRYRDSEIANMFNIDSGIVYSIKKQITWAWLKI
jgi:hypothetical protein